MLGAPQVALLGIRDSSSPFLRGLKRRAERWGMRGGEGEMKPHQNNPFHCSQQLEARQRGEPWLFSRVTFSRTRSVWDWQQISSLPFCHSKHCELEPSLLKVINGRELLGGAQLWHGLSGAMEGALFTFTHSADHLPLFSGLLFINGCLGVTGIPARCVGKRCFCHSEAGLCLKAAGRIRRGFLPSKSSDLHQDNAEYGIF